MRASQSVYLINDRTKAVPEGDKDARFLLVREGHEISDAELEKYEGAEKLVGSKRKGEEAPRPESHADSNVPKQPRKRASRAKK